MLVCGVIDCIAWVSWVKIWEGTYLHNDGVCDMGTIPVLFPSEFIQALLWHIV